MVDLLIFLKFFFINFTANSGQIASYSSYGTFFPGNSLNERCFEKKSLPLNMVHSCAAYNCTERYRKGGIAFHSFPNNQELRDQWIKALRRSNFTPNQYSKLCAKHFTPDCYEKAPWSFLKRLKEGAVPTVFEFSPCFKRKYQKKSLDNSSTDVQDRDQDETDTTVEQSVYIPVKRSPSRRKQLIIERKDFNLSNSVSSGVKLVTFSANETEVPGEAETIGSVASLPSKRFRKKTKFSDDFVSEYQISKRRGKAIKSLPDTGIGKGLSNEKDKCDANKTINQSSLDLLDKEEVKSTDVCILISNNSSVERYEDISLILDEENTKTESIPMEYIVLEKMVELDETLNNPTEACQSTSHTRPDKSILKDQVDSNNKKIKKHGRKVLIEDINFDDASIQKEVICNAKERENEAINTIMISNNSSVETYKDISVILEEENKKLDSIPKPLEYIVLEKVVELDEMLNKPTEACQSTSHTRPDKSIFKENHVDSNKKKVEKCRRKVLIDDASIQKEAISNTKEKENEAISTENVSIADSSINNMNEKNQNNAVEKIFNHQKSTAVNLNGGNERDNTETAKEINYTNISTENILTCSAATTSSQKTPTVLKLNLEEEEAILQRCVLLGEAANEEKLVRLEKVNGNKSKSFSSNQNLKSLRAPSRDDETLNDSKRKSYIGDFKAEDLVSPEKAAKCFKVAQKVIKEKSLEIKLLRQRERRLMQKVEELENVIYHLVEKKMNPEEASTVLIVLKEND